MRELREDTFSGNKNNDAHEHVERVLDIVSLFNIPGVSHDAVMLSVFPIPLIGTAKRWKPAEKLTTKLSKVLRQRWIAIIGMAEALAALEATLKIKKKNLKKKSKVFEDEEDDLEENLEDLEECGEDKANTIIGVIHDKLSDGWFNNTSEDEDDLEGILDYLKPRSYDGFIDLDDKAYNKRRCKLLGMTYEEPTTILIKKVKVTRYTVSLGETYTKVNVLRADEIPRTRDNIVAMRARLLEKMPHKGNG
ncbi:hypothetical protein Tco_0925867 [Tanacetum coccineum]|uniref:Uncharacterized protein n=1 Tax=Tanacetum coccineum TaxID=301880 RepID=A0ABQ5DA42_9ASTR